MHRPKYLSKSHGNKNKTAYQGEKLTGITALFQQNITEEP
jgi:hypothetical protein